MVDLPVSYILLRLAFLILDLVQGMMNEDMMRTQDGPSKNSHASGCGVEIRIVGIGESRELDTDEGLNGGEDEEE
jgi:hypothetical protein